ncbi:SCO family protein [Undibacterium sp. TS12]|uniref:SCO family protein n=1 Tax=Undibacterium sp. TS12 TaxID=2908202 RepID=UPI001F4C91CD|nr:SCO family protein [Undibacterium sp. TS12]MCH8622468.1 SCO family protein [Undibacterium sp. TS12]
MQHLHHRRRQFIAGAGLLLILAGSNMAKASGLLYQLPLHWTTDKSQAVTLNAFSGKPVVLAMAYGACKRICSTTIFRMEQIQTILDQRQVDANFIVVGLDPKSDKPEDWQDFRQMRKLQRHNWSFLSGNPADTKSLAANLGINYWIYHDHVIHDFKITLLDKDGNVVRSMLNAGNSLEEFLQGLPARQ